MNTHAGGGPIVVGVDASDSARIAGDWAADLAAGWGVPLRLVHVAGEREPRVGGGDGSDQPPWLVELAAAAERAGAACTAEVARGAVADVLAERSATAGLLVLGSYGRGAHTGLLAGTIALAMVERSACPVAVVRGTAPGVPPAPHGPVVVGLDDGAGGRAALQFGAALAVALGARLQAVHAWTELVTSETGATRREDDLAALEAQSAAVLDAAVQRLQSLRPELPVAGELVAGTSMRALLDRAETARMIVVGHRRHAAPESELRPGSTATALVAFAPCPVVVLGPGSLRAGASPAGDGVGARR